MAAQDRRKKNINVFELKLSDGSRRVMEFKDTDMNRLIKNSYAAMSEKYGVVSEWIRKNKKRI